MLYIGLNIIKSLNYLWRIYCHPDSNSLVSLGRKNLSSLSGHKLLIVFKLFSGPAPEPVSSVTLAVPTTIVPSSRSKQKLNPCQSNSAVIYNFLSYILYTTSFGIFKLILMVYGHVKDRQTYLSLPLAHYSVLWSGSETPQKCEPFTALHSEYELWNFSFTRILDITTQFKKYTMCKCFNPPNHYFCFLWKGESLETPPPWLHCQLHHKKTPVSKLVCFAYLLGTYF